MSKKALCCLFALVMFIFRIPTYNVDAAYEESVEFDCVGSNDGIVYTTEFYGSNGGIRFENGNVEVRQLPNGVINEGMIYSFCFYHDKIYYQTGEACSDPTMPGKIYRCNIDGNNNVVIADNVQEWSNSFIVDNYLYYEAYTTVEWAGGPANHYGGIYKLNLDNMKSTKIVSGENANLCYCDGDYVYYRLGGTCLATSIDGSNTVDIPSNASEVDNEKVIKGNTAYYFSDDKLCSSDRSGLNERVVCSAQLMGEYSFANVECVNQKDIYYIVYNSTRYGNKAYVYRVDRSKNDKIKITLNGTELSFDQQPIIVNDRTMVPVRAIFEALGYDVSWDKSKQEVVANGSRGTIVISIGSNYMSVNGNSTYIDSPAIIVNDRTLVPARAISEAAGCSVSWDENTRTVSITK